MNDKAFEDKVKEDIDTVKEDGYTGLNRLEDKVNQSTTKVKEVVTTWAEDGAAQVNRKLENFKDGVVVAAKTAGQDVDQGLNQYNVKVQELVDQVPGGFGNKAARYPWVTISISLMIGFLLGMLLKPAHRSPA